MSVVAGFEAHPNPVGAGQAQPGADTLAHRQPLDPGPHPLEFGLVLGVYQLTQVGIWWPRHPGQGWCGHRTICRWVTSTTARASSPRSSTPSTASRTPCR